MREFRHTAGYVMKRKRENIFGDLVSTLTVTVLFFVILMLVVFSAVSYQRSVEIQDANGNARAVLSYVITAVKANEASRVTLEEQDGMQVLVIEDAAAGYGQQIFYKDGKVRENYGKSGMPVLTDDALEIGEAKQFSFVWKKENLLEIQSDAGTSYIHVRN